MEQFQQLLIVCFWTAVLVGGIVLFARWIGKRTALTQAYEKKYHLDPLRLKKLLPDEMKAEFDQSGMRWMSQIGIYWFLLTLSFEPLSRLTSESASKSVYSHLPALISGIAFVLLLLYITQFHKRAGDRVTAIDRNDPTFSARLPGLFHKVSWGVFGALLVALLFHSDQASFWDWLSLAIPLYLVLVTSKYVKQFAVYENGFRLTVYFVPWENVGWYRWYDRAEAIIFGTKQPIGSVRYFILELPDESRENLAALIDEKLSGKRLEDVEEVLANETEKETTVGAVHRAFTNDGLTVH